MSTKKDDSQIEKVRHSLAHIMAAAVQELYPGVKFGIGPVIENGFYYDFDFRNVILSRSPSQLSLKVGRARRRIPKPVHGQRDSSLPAVAQNDKAKITPEDLPRIEKRMRQLIKKNLKFEKKIVPHSEAKEIFKGQPYKLELIQDLSKGSPLMVYQSGDFIDLCKGPHIESTKEIDPKGFKLHKVAGAYWRGDEKNPMLTRIYGLAFATEKELNQYLERLREAEKRDHRKLGKDLDLFSFHEQGPGFVFWHPKGLFIREKLVEYWRKQHKKAGYQEISTPLLLKENLWHTSKHMETYKENMYFSKIDDQNYVIKPMNCPGGLLMYKERQHSYKELPLRVAEMGLVHRHEMAGVLHGLMRVRAFTQDDAHIYCTRDQVEDELKGVLNLTLDFYKHFGFNDFHMELSTRPEKYTGDLKLWDLAEKTLEKVLKDMNLDYKINPRDGAFYGPKIDSHLKDSIGRTWQCGTLQLDFAQPENFELEYIDQNGKKQRPVMLHRTIYGSLERFIGILLEHYAGSLPLWLSPVQAQVIPVGGGHQDYAQKITAKLKQKNLRAETALESDTVSKKIRQAELQKTPYILVVGDKEIKNQTVNVRSRDKGLLGEMPIESFLKKIE